MTVGRLTETSESVGSPDAQTGVISLNSSGIWLKFHIYMSLLLCLLLHLI